MLLACIVEWVSEWLFFNANSEIAQLYHGNNKLICIINDEEVRFVLDQQALLDLYNASSLKQQFANRHVAPLAYIMIQSQSVFALSP
jgi:hypothetical protein